MSHPARGAWIETGAAATLAAVAAVSHPARGAWIETRGNPTPQKPNPCRTPLGVRGLKHYRLQEIFLFFGRTPLGVRGLKLD